MKELSAFLPNSCHSSFGHAKLLTALHNVKLKQTSVFPCKTNLVPLLARVHLKSLSNIDQRKLYTERIVIDGDERSRL